MKHPIPEWLTRLNASALLRPCVSLIINNSLRRFDPGDLPDDLPNLLDSLFIRDRIGNIDADGDGRVDSFSISIIPSWFDQRVLSVEIDINGLRVLPADLYLRTAGRTIVSSDIHGAALEPGRIVECVAAGHALSSGIHFLSIRIQLEIETYEFQRLPIRVRRNRADFAFLPPRVPQKVDNSLLDIHLVPHTQYDSEGPLTREQSETLAARNLYEALDIMRRSSEYTFVVGQVSFLRPFKQNHPDAYQQLAAHVRNGRIEAVCAFHSEPDTNLVGGESLIRQAVLWQKFALKEFGGHSKTGWLTGAFGQAAQLPQILALAGVDALIFRHTGRTGMPTEFQWEGLDGTRIRAHWISSPGAGAHPLSDDNEAALDRIENEIARAAGGATGKNILLAHGAPHGRPQLRAVDIKNIWNDISPERPIKFSTPSKFIASVDWTGTHVLHGDFNGACPGTHSARAPLKQRNAAAENSVLDAEAAAALAVAFAAAPIPEIDSIWEDICRSQSHGVITGRCSDPVAEAAESRFRKSAEAADELTRAALRRIADWCGPSDVPSFIVFNPLAMRRSDWIETTLYFQTGAVAFQLWDLFGECPYQILDFSRYSDGSIKTAAIGFVARDIPGCGFRRYEVRPGVPADVETVTSYDNYTLANEQIAVHLHPEARCIERVRRKSDNTDPAFVFGNECFIEEDAGDLLDSEPAGERVHARRMGWTMSNLETGKLRTSVSIGGKLRQSSVRQTLILAAGRPWLEVRCDVDFRDPDRRLCVRFPSDPREETWTHAVPFGAVSRAAGRHPVAGWITAIAGGAPYSVLCPGMPAWELTPGEINLVLLRGAGRLRNADRPGAQCLGPHTFRYAIHFHNSPWAQARVPAAAASFSRPLLAAALRTGPVKSHLPWEASLVTVSPDNLIPTAVYPSAGGTFILRFHESTGAQAEAELRFGLPVSLVRKVDALERPLANIPVESDGTARVAVRPFEIVTVSFRIDK